MHLLNNTPIYFFLKKNHHSATTDKKTQTTHKRTLSNLAVPTTKKKTQEMAATIIDNPTHAERQSRLLSIEQQQVHACNVLITYQLYHSLRTHTLTRFLVHNIAIHINADTHNTNKTKKNSRLPTDRQGICRIARRHHTWLHNSTSIGPR